MKSKSKFTSYNFQIVSILSAQATLLFSVPPTPQALRVTYAESPTDPVSNVPITVRRQPQPVSVSGLPLPGSGPAIISSMAADAAAQTGWQHDDIVCTPAMLIAVGGSTDPKAPRGAPGLILHPYLSTLSYEQQITRLNEVIAAHLAEATPAV